VKAVVTQSVISLSGVNICGVRVYALARIIPASNGGRNSAGTGGVGGTGGAGDGQPGANG
jgi:hypothetical protein